MKSAILIMLTLSALAAAACGSDSTDDGAGAVPGDGTTPAAADTPAAVSAPKTASAPPTAAPQAAASVPETAVCAPGATIEEQKATLAATANAQFQGNTRENLPRLPYGADVRDRRQGGLWVVVEFRGDELKTVAERKATLNRQMADTYAAVFGAGCEDLKWVDLTGLQRAIAKVGMMGDPAKPYVPVFKTRMTADEAKEIDWDNRHSLDFNEIWETLLLNPRWRQELEGTGGN